MPRGWPLLFQTMRIILFVANHWMPLAVFKQVHNRMNTSSHPSIKSNMSLYRNIESSKNSPELFPIHKLTVFHTDKTSFLVLSPGKLRISATLFLSKIIGKGDFINIDLNHRVKRQDLLVAAESMIMEMDNNNDKRSLNQLNDQKISPKRPPNAFMLYSSTLRKRIKRTFPEYDNSNISKFLGIMWRSASSSIKQKFIKMAYEERQRHKMHYPDFEYNSAKAMTSSATAFPHAQENITENDEWIREIQQFVQQTEDFETVSYPTLAKMESEAIELINSFSTDFDYEDSQLTSTEHQWLPSHHWINCDTTDDMDARNWRDMCNSISLVYPEGPEDNLVFKYSQC